ncbi:MAG TPA: hypothetical protein VLA30_01235 [Burkholderiales bacterium]|nr:hypothetical protein [Burkholderiales bacterium]
MNVWKWLGLAALAGASALIFAAYQRPDTMVSLTSAFLALCGFK